MLLHRNKANTKGFSPFPDYRDHLPWDKPQGMTVLDAAGGVASDDLKQKQSRESQCGKSRGVSEEPSISTTAPRKAFDASPWIRTQLGQLMAFQPLPPTCSCYQVSGHFLKCRSGFSTWLKPLSFSIEMLLSFVTLDHTP